MWPPAIVVIDPAGDICSGVIEIKEQGLVEKLVAHAAVEALTEAVLHGLSRCDKMPCDRVVLRPCEDGVRGELRAVVRDDQAWLAAALNESRQFARNASSGDRGVRDRRQAFPRDVVDDIEDAKPAAVGGGADEEGLRC